jgi:hypothetical protein
LGAPGGLMWCFVVGVLGIVVNFAARGARRYLLES